MTTQHDRPRWCADRAVDDWKKTLDDGEPLPMLKTLKILRVIIVNVGATVMASLLAYYGSDPTILAVLYFGFIGSYNGLELSDYIALLQAVKEADIESADQNDTE